MADTVTDLGWLILMRHVRKVVWDRVIDSEHQLYQAFASASLEDDSTLVLSEDTDLMPMLTVDFGDFVSAPRKRAPYVIVAAGELTVTINIFKLISAEDQNGITGLLEAVAACFQQNPEDNNYQALTDYTQAMAVNNKVSVFSAEVSTAMPVHPPLEINGETVEQGLIELTINYEKRA